MKTSRNGKIWLPAAALGLLLVAAILPLDTQAADGYFADRSDDELFSESRGGPAGGPKDNRNPNGYLFSKRRSHRFLTVQAGQRTVGGGDFEGDTFYSGTSEAFLIPKVESAVFYGLYLDFRSGNFGGGFGYSRGSHDWSWAGLKADPAQVTSHFVDFDFRFHMLPKSDIQPFGLLGFSLNGLRVEDGKVNADTVSLSRLSMWGLGVNYGVGVDYYVGRRLKITGGARWYANSYNSISGQDLDEGLIATGVNYYGSIGISID